MRFPSTRPSSVLGASLLAFGVLLVVRSAHPSAQVAPTAAAGASRLAHGEYLVKTGGCNDCHTPWKLGDNGPEPDMSKMLMGHPAGLVANDPPGLQLPWIGSASSTMTSWSGPWGRSYTANLTSDRETGIGAWTERQFIDTIRSGKHWGNGRPLLPTMPWPAFRNLADDDLAAIFAYLQTVPAIRNKVPDPVVAPGPPPEPLPTTKLLKVAPGQADPVSRGRYLVTAKGCGDCHTPMKMGSKGPEYDMTRMLSGFDARGAVPPMPPIEGAGEVYVLEPAFAGGWGMSFAANLTSDVETGLGSWTEQQFLDTLRNGRHQGRGRQLVPPMPWQIFGQMNDADLKAIFAYLRTVPAVKNKVPDPVAPAPSASSKR
ncbi:G3-ADH subunit II [Luteitalea pratensis]|uniref:G3-ADH subunit II n=2 Tax=Luteitalea pratensis TaxID=1855912 RepID=A0A143PG84_LUTPR|nr:G3-ADH subunit II [Luteitalea pratensis]